MAFRALGAAAEVVAQDVDAYAQRLGAAGLVVVDGLMHATDAERDALGADYEPLPVGVESQRHWLGRLPEGERSVLEVVLAAYPGGASREQIGEVAGYKRSTRDAYLRRLRARRLVTGDRGDVRAPDDLF